MADSAASSGASATERVRPAAAAAGGAGAAPSFANQLRELVQELPGLFNDRIELLSLELKRAGGALLQMIVLIVAAAILGVTGWLVLWGAIVAALYAAGLPLALALGAALLVNLAAAAWAALRVRKLLPLLKLPATRRHLLISPSTRPVTPTSPTTSAASPMPPPGSGASEFSHARPDRTDAGQPVAS